MPRFLVVASSVRIDTRITVQMLGHLGVILFEMGLKLAYEDDFPIMVLDAYKSNEEEYDWRAGQKSTPTNLWAPSEVHGCHWAGVVVDLWTDRQIKVIGVWF